MTNAEKFQQIFNLYATELWALPEKDFLKWLNTEIQPEKEKKDIISRQAAVDEAERWLFDRDDNRTVEKMLRDLPSSEPEKVCITKIILSEEQVREAVERAKNKIIQMLPSAQPTTCKYWDNESSFCALHRPSAQPERKRGKWIKGGEQPYFRKHFDIVVCSICNKRGEHRWNFCPYCGADMRGEEDD